MRCEARRLVRSIWKHARLSRELICPPVSVAFRKSVHSTSAPKPRYRVTPCDCCWPNGDGFDVKLVAWLFTTGFASCLCVHPLIRADGASSITGCVQDVDRPCCLMQSLIRSGMCIRIRKAQCPRQVGTQASDMMD